NRRAAQVGNHLPESGKRFLVLQPNPGSKMIQALLVTLCLAIFPYQGYSVVTSLNTELFAFQTKYDDTMQYEFKVNGEPVVLHLEKNKGLFSKDYSETHYSPDGKEITTSPQVENTWEPYSCLTNHSPIQCSLLASIQDHCYYNGHIQNDTDSIASISACHGLNEAHALFKYESLEKEDRTLKICGVANTTWEPDEPIKKTSRTSMSAEKKEYLQAKKHVELFIAVDNRMFRRYSRNINAVKMRVFDVVNYINTVYKPMKVHIALIGLEIWSDEDKIEVNTTAGVTLNHFSTWRESVLLKRKRNDNAQLLTAINFDGPTVGLAFVGTMCSPSFSSGIVQDHSNNPIAIGATMAHEIGHNLGMNHDTDFCTCKADSCIMTPQQSYKPPREFSSCSFQDYQKYILNETPQCIINRPLKKDIITPPVCGNDFVEEGEECDCGSPKFKKAGAVCRAAKHDCDLPEMCTGQSAPCPLDRFRVNGHPCQNNQGYCYMGKCPTLANQCISLWGPGGKVAADSCFSINQKGVYYGHCRKASGTYIPCKPKDLKCGKLYCIGGSKMPSAGSLVSFESCKGSFPRGNAEDVGMVDPGTKCGEGMVSKRLLLISVCNNGQCVEIETAYRSTNCSHKCTGHSVSIL
ncbi:hypothetical protein Chor_002295, partial [Crotalus horridus]